MATEVGSAYVSIVPSAKGFGRNLTSSVGRQVDTSGKDSGKRFGKGFTGGVGSAVAGVGRSIALIAGPLAVLGGIRVLGNFVTDARESARISALTAQAIKSTGGAAKVTAKDVSRLSTAISNKTGVDDEQIQSGANLLLTFTNIRNELGKGNKIFDRANQTVTDMSAALGQDTKSSAIQLGKALNDPIKGITALSRVGVSFTQQQKDQIKAMVASGDTLGAQKVILKELSKEFGGAAAAMATPGDRLKVTLGNVGEAIGAQLIPVIDQFAKFMVDRGIPALVQFGGFLKVNVLPVLKQFGAFVLTTVVPAMLRFGGFLQTNVLPPLRSFGQFIATSVLPALRSLATFILTVVYPVIGKILVNVFAGLRSAIGSIKAALDRNQGSVTSFTTAFRTVATFIITKVLPVLGPLLRIALIVLGKTIGVVITIVIRLISTLARIISTIVRIDVAIARFVTRVVTFFVNLEAKVRGVVGGFGTLLFQAGKDLILGLVNGIKSLATAPVDAVKGIGNKVKNGFKSVLGIGSPSKVFAGFGVNINEGIVQGMRGSTSLLRGAAENSAGALTAGFRSRNPAALARTAVAPHGGAGAPTVINVNNPLPERASDTVPKVIRRKLHTQGLALP